MMTHCLDIPVILREIFKHFSTTELLRLSLVDKAWNNEARCVLRKRGTLTATINKRNTCQDPRAFASDLRRMKDITKVVPFSGITITLGGEDWDHGAWCKIPSTRGLDQVYKEILDRIPVKHLSVKFKTGWKKHRNCPGFLLVKKILKTLGSVLEEFSLELVWDVESFAWECLQECRFSRLKTLRLLGDHGSSSEDDTNLIKALVSNAPNLQFLYSDCQVNLRENLLEGSSAVHVTNYQYSPSYHTISESVASKLRMQRMDLTTFSRDISMERFQRIMQVSLETSHGTLRSMYVNPIFLAPLMNYGIWLDSVRKLEMHLGTEGLQGLDPKVRRLVRSFDFTRTFPSMHTVEIHTDYAPCYVPRGFGQIIEQCNVTLRNPIPDRAINVKNLILNGCEDSLVHSYTTFLAEIFPNIQKLSIQVDEVPFERLRDAWPELKELDVTLRSVSYESLCLEAEFCGIFPEEVEELREKDDEYLKAVKIVPVMPSLRCLNGLRKFNFFLRCPDAFVELVDDPTFVFSKVTGFIAFRRYPDLAVTLVMDNERLEQALSHMRPFASVVLGSATNEF